MKNCYHPLRQSHRPFLFILLMTCIPGIVQAQWDPEYWVDETATLTVTNVRLNIINPVDAYLEIRVLDNYYSSPYDDSYLEYPEDISGMLTDRAVAWLTTTTFGDVTLGQVMHDLTEHLESHTASALVKIVLSVPTQNRGSLPFSLSMQAGRHDRIELSVSLNSIQTDLPGSDVRRIDVAYETLSTDWIDPSQIRSAVYDFLSQNQVEPDQPGVSHRLMTDHLTDSFEEILNIRSVMNTYRGGPVPVYFTSKIEQAAGQLFNESLVMRVAGTGNEDVIANMEGAGSTSGRGLKADTGLSSDTDYISDAGYNSDAGSSFDRGYRLVLDYSEGLDSGDFPDLSALNDLILTRISEFDTTSTGWMDFMNESLKQLENEIGSAAEYISFYMDSGIPHEDVEIRYLSRKGIPLYGNEDLYTGYELDFDSVSTFLGSTAAFRIELADFYRFYDGQMPEPDVLADTLIRHAMNPDYAINRIENEVILHRYLNYLAYNLGELNYWMYLYNGSVESEMSGTDESGMKFHHFLNGRAGSSGKFAEGAGLPTVIRLLQNYPNPFNPVTYITFEIVQATEIRLEIFDLNGRKVAEPAGGMHNQGVHIVRFDAGNLASGLYIARLQAGSDMKYAKLMLIK